MNVFRKKSKRELAEPSISPDSELTGKDDSDEGLSSPTSGESYAQTPSSYSIKSAPINASRSIGSMANDLMNVKQTSSESAAKILRKLFAMSEHAEYEVMRVQMVESDEGALVPALFDFLKRCPKGSTEWTLTLLVMNNLTVPMENKRTIAVKFGGARSLGRHLCEDPSCHLLAIILVNLTYADVELRRELTKKTTDIDLVEALAFALRVASMTQKELGVLQPLLEIDEESETTPRQLLKNLLDEEERLRKCEENPFGNTLRSMSHSPSDQLFPQTARWCICALKNLTLPSNDPTACMAFVNSGILPYVLGFITIAQAHHDNASVNTIGETSSSSSKTPIPADPQDGDASNPSAWDSQTPQDAALYIILNLSAMPWSRTYLLEADAVRILRCITEFEVINQDRASSGTSDLVNFQCMKARMALAFLCGSEGHFGQPPKPPTQMAADLENVDDTVLFVSDHEINQLVELLANVLHHRAKKGEGGYANAAFDVNTVVAATRYLLTVPDNQSHVARVAGPKLNTLLLKVLARFAVQRVVNIEAETAEHAVFSLYLLSNSGFQHPFLPASYGSKDPFKGPVAKVLSAYADCSCVTAAGAHAADQLLMRLKYLKFDGNSGRLAHRSHMEPSDFAFDRALQKQVDNIIVQNRKIGAKPRPDIFDRPVLRARALRGKNVKAPWDNHAYVDTFSSVLVAVQELSFGSLRVRHLDGIDDIVIANNIANSANGEKTESYSFMWSWQDTAGEIQRNLERQHSTESFLSFKSAVGPGRSIVGRTLGAVNLCHCGVDTTICSEVPMSRTSPRKRAQQ